MAEGRRPGGLTALAVLNFVFGGLGAIAFLLGLLGAGIIAASDADVEGKVAGLLLIAVLLTGVSATLLIVSGIGYLGQKKVMGRYLGTAYGLLGILGTVLGLVGGGGFGIGTVIGLVYPVLTLILVNTTFKDDLVN